MRKLHLLLVLLVAPLLWAGDAHRGKGGGGGGFASTLDGNNLTDESIEYLKHMGSFENLPEYPRYYFSADATAGCAGDLPLGVDTNPGTKTSPLRSLAKAVALNATGYVHLVFDSCDVWDQVADWGVNSMDVSPTCLLANEEVCTIWSGSDFSGVQRPTFDCDGIGGTIGGGADIGLFRTNAGGAYLDTWIAYQNLIFTDCPTTSQQKQDIWRHNAATNMILLNVKNTGLMGPNNQLITSHATSGPSVSVSINTECNVLDDQTEGIAITNGTLAIVDAAGCTPATADCLTGANFAAVGFLVDHSILLSDFTQGAANAPFVVSSVSATELGLGTTALTAEAGTGNEDVNITYMTQCLNMAGIPNQSVLAIGGSYTNSVSEISANLAGSGVVMITTSGNSAAVSEDLVVLGAHFVDLATSGLGTGAHRAIQYPVNVASNFSDITIANSIFTGWTQDGVTAATVAQAINVSSTGTNGTTNIRLFRNSFSSSEGVIGITNINASEALDVWGRCNLVDGITQTIFDDQSPACDGSDVDWRNAIYDDADVGANDFAIEGIGFNDDDAFLVGSDTRNCNGGGGYTAWGAGVGGIAVADPTSTNTATDQYGTMAAQGKCNNAICLSDCVSRFTQTWPVLYLPAFVGGTKVTGVSLNGNNLNIGQ